MIRVIVLFIYILAFYSNACAGSLEERIEKLEESLKREKNQNALNPSISVIVDSTYYNTNLSGDEMEEREIEGYRALHGHEGDAHAHGETREGFNLRSAEIGFFAPVDPYFNLKATIPVSEGGAELEEAYFVTTALPAGLQLKGGKFKSGFGRFNSFHTHSWGFVDEPLPYRAFLGREGLIEKGAQLTYLPDLPVYTLVGIETLQGENEVLFGEEAGSGPHAYVVFAKSSIDFGESSTILFGLSVADGKTKTGSIEHDTDFEGDSTLYDLEMTYKWKPSKTRSFALQGEYMLRDQSGDFIEDTTVPTPAETLKRKQDGLYLQGLYQINRWRLGARYDLLDLFNDDFIQAGVRADFGGRPYRATGAVEYNPTEFSRIRVQYNDDRSSRDGAANREVFLQFIFGIGAHAAHTF